MQWFDKVLIIVGFTLFVGCFSLTATAAPKNYEMMLIGSDFKFCRSSATNYCDSSEIASLSQKKYRKAIQYKLVTSQIKKMMKVELWKPSRQALRYDLQLLFNGIIKKAGLGVLSYSQLIHIWKSVTIKRDGKIFSGHSLFLSMTEDELTMILDHLEFEQVDYAGRRFKEKVSSIKSNTSPTMDFVTKIVESTKLRSKSPHILIATVGNRDSFVDVDSYIDLFSQMGVETSWLPIDAALNQLLFDKKECDQLENYRAKVLNSYDRKRLYSDLIKTQVSYCKNDSLFTTAIDKADTLVIIGDDPALLNNSFMTNNVDNSLLQQIKKKVKTQKLSVVAIGNMVKGVVAKGANGAIILQGDSESAMKNGTSTMQQFNDVCQNYGSCEKDYHRVLYAQGGVGLVDFPIIDTEVSTNGNIARLAKVGADSKLNLGLSIDKDTALLIHQENSTKEIKVIGQQGVILLENVSNSNDLFRLKYSYFTPEDEIIFNNKDIEINYPQWKKAPKQFDAQLAEYKNLFYGDNFKRFTEQACVVNNEKWAGNAGRNQQFRMEIEKNSNKELIMGALKIDDGYQLYCSIDAMSISLKRN